MAYAHAANTGLMETPGPPKLTKDRFLAYLGSSIRVNTIVEFELLLLTFSTGIQDAICFPDFSCFASNQTGNTVLLAVGVAGNSGSNFYLPTVGMSLAMFLAGVVVTGQTSNWIGPRRRWWLILNNTIQTLLVLAAAIIQKVQGVQATGPSALGVMALLAFSSGAQVASARPMRLPEITTAMATAAWVDLLVDPQLYVPLGKNRQRNRRALFLASLIAGSFAGAFMRSRIGSALALAISASGKAVVALAFFVNQKEQKELPMCLTGTQMQMRDLTP